MQHYQVRHWEVKMNIYKSGIVYTQNGIQQAFVTDGGRFVYVGDEEGAMAYEGNVIDLQGRFVCAGFNDSHMHLLNFGYTLCCADLSKCTKSISQLIETFRLWKEEQSDEQQWLWGRGFNQDYFQDEHRMLNRYDLDKVDNTKPVVAVRACGHICVVNTKALEVLGLKKQPQVEGGFVDVDSKGQLLGIFRDNAMRLVYNQMPAFSVKEVKDMLKQAAQTVNRYGVTSVQTDDFAAFPSTSWQTVVKAYEELRKENQLTVRVSEQCCLDKLEMISEFIEQCWIPYQENGNQALNEKNEKADCSWFKPGSLKIVGDGSLGARTAYMLKSYNDDETTKGIKMYETEELVAMIRLARNNKMPVCIHAIGDGMMEMVLDAYEAVLLKKLQSNNEKEGCRRGSLDHRCGVVHCQIMRPEHYRRFQQLGLHAYIQSIFLDYDIRIVEQRVGKTIAKSSYNFKRFLDMGISLSNGSDCPVELPDVMKGIQCAVTRKSLDGVWGPYLPDQALTVKEALDSYTIGGAYASFEENQKGDIKEGMLADFVILGENPFEVESNAISDIPVLETWVNGICVYKNPLK